MLENRYAPHYVGKDGGGGIFSIDGSAARVGWRLSVPRDCTPEALWVYYRTAGSFGQVRLRLCPGLASDPRQPDLSGGSIRWVPQPSASPRWERIDLAQGTTSFKSLLAEGDALHVVLERQSGVFSPTDRVDVVTVRSRFPIQHGPYSTDGDTYRDDLSAVLRTPAHTDPSQPYVVQRETFASYHPIFLLECSDGPSIGNPYDRHLEIPIFGPHAYAHYAFLPSAMDVSMIAMPVRGAGSPGDSGAPSDHLYLEVFRHQLPDGVPELVFGPAKLVDKGDQMFLGRTHWFSLFAGSPLHLEAGNSAMYAFVVSSPGSGLLATTDGYLLSIEQSTLPHSVAPPTWAWRRSYAGPWPQVFSSAQQRSILTDCGLILRDTPSGVVAIVDEISGAPLPWPSHATPGTTIQFPNLLVRNVGANAGASDVWSRVRDADSLAVLSGPTLHAAMDHHKENGVAHQFTMPSQDVRLLLECGHCSPAGSGLGGTLVVDDHAPGEVRRI